MNIFKNKQQQLKLYKILHFFCFLIAWGLFSFGVLQLLPFEIKHFQSFFFNSLFGISVILLIQKFLTTHHKINFKNIMGFSFKKTPTHLRQGLLGFCYIITINFLIFNILNLLINGDLDFIPTKKQHNLAIVLSAVGIAPWFEEILFRGYIQSFFMKFTSNSTSIFITSFLFMFFHIQYWENIFSLIAVFVLSIVLGVLRIKSKSVTPCIFTHFLNNLLAVIRV